MSDELRLKSFEVEGFRAIRRLSLPVLGRVNLFVGENNAGKSSLLEALQLYAYRNRRSLPAVLLAVAPDHTGNRLRPLPEHSDEVDSVELQTVVETAEGLFFGSFSGYPLRPIRMAPNLEHSTYLTISLSPNGTRNRGGEPTVAVAPSAPLVRLSSEAGNSEIPLEWFTRRFPIFWNDEPAPAVVVPSEGVTPASARTLWDEIALSGDESLVSDALRIMIPGLERIVVVGEAGVRSVLCKVAGVPRPIPIKSMGDGTNRIFGLAVALVQARGGALLIDEVENGLHRSVHDDVWKLIFTQAEALDVQVFATTHSWEAVVGFQAAANRSPAEGMLYRLERGQDGDIYVEGYTEKEVAIATEHQIEVR